MTSSAKFYDKNKIAEEVQAAIQRSLAVHGIELYSLLGTCLSLEAIGSPLKKQFGRGGLGKDMGLIGLKALSASLLPCEVECLQDPNQPDLNRLIDSIALTLSHSGTPVPHHLLRLRAWRIYENRPDMKSADLLKAWGNDQSLEHKYEAALRTLVVGGIVERDPEDIGWQLAEWARFRDSESS